MADIYTVEDYNAELGNRVKNKRKELDITQGDLSESTGISASSISDIETGRRKMDEETLATVCKGLGITPEELTEGLEMPVANVRLKADLGLADDTIEKLKVLVSGATKEEIEALNAFICAESFGDFICELAKSIKGSRFCKKMYIKLFGDEEDSDFSDEECELFRSIVTTALDEEKTKITEILHKIGNELKSV